MRTATISRLTLALCLILFAAMVTGPARAGPPPSEAAYQKARRAFYRFKDDKEKQKFRHNWKNVAGKFEAVAEKYPDSSRAPDALFTAGKLYHDLYKISRVSADLDHSIELFSKLVERFGQNHLADDAQYYIAFSLLQFKKDKQKARKELARLVADFPDGDQRHRAQRMLEDLGGPPEGKEHHEPGGKAPEGPAKKVSAAAAKEGEPGGQEGALLEDIRHWSNPGYTRIALYTRQKVRYRVGKLAGSVKRDKPPRLYIDLMDTELGDELDHPLKVSDSIVSRIRFAERDEGFIRVVIDLTAAHTHRVIPMSNPDRVVIDITAGEDTIGRVIGKKMHEKPGKTQKKKIEGLKKKSKPRVSLSAMAGLKVKRVVIDAGHGGRDPGAIGAKGTMEKKIALDVGFRLAKLMKKNLKLEVLMTRKKDHFVPLEARTAYANKKEADLFISIHFNAHRNRKFRGVETFYLDLTDDRYSIKLAARENATSEKSISDLQYILADLALKSHVDDSIRLSKFVQRGMVGKLRRKYKRVRDMGIKPALFYVLIGARMPSILIEGSFITNPMEEKRLKSKDYRQRLAEGICAGIANFIDEREKFLDPDN